MLARTRERMRRARIHRGRNTGRRPCHAPLTYSNQLRLRQPNFPPLPRTNVGVACGLRDRRRPRPEVEVPSVNGLATAESLGRLVACLANGGVGANGVRILKENTILNQVSHVSRVLQNNRGGTNVALWFSWIALSSTAREVNRNERSSAARLIPPPARDRPPPRPAQMLADPKPATMRVIGLLPVAFTQGGFDRRDLPSSVPRLDQHDAVYAWAGWGGGGCCFNPTRKAAACFTSIAMTWDMNLALFLLNKAIGISHGLDSAEKRASKPLPVAACAPGSCCRSAAPHGAQVKPV